MSTESRQPGAPAARNEFPPTHWTMVLAAGERKDGGHGAALDEFCATYWRPLYAFARSRGYNDDDAKDLTQSYFEALLRKQFLSAVEREGGRFRSFLLTTFKRFLVNEWQRARAQKRGGGEPLVMFDDEAQSAHAAAHPATPDIVFEQQWAMALLDRVLLELEREWVSRGKQEQFLGLRSFLPGQDGGASYTDVCAKLDMSTDAARMAVSRLRQRYGELLRVEIANTVGSTEEIDDEIRHLIAVVSGK